MEKLKSWFYDKYVAVRDWAKNSEVVLAARAGAVVLTTWAATILSGFDYNSVLSGLMSWKQALVAAAVTWAFEWLRKYRAEDM